MNKNLSLFRGSFALSMLLFSGSAFAQNPILKSSTAVAPTTIAQIVPSVLTENTSYIGVGTTTPTQRLTLKWLSKSYVVDGMTRYTNEAPSIRFEFKPVTPISAPEKIWHLTGGESFELWYMNSSLKPLSVSPAGEAFFYNKVNLSTSDVTALNDNRLGFFTDNTRRRILWTSYTTAGGNDAAIPLEFMYDAMGTGATDVSVMTMMPNGRVGIGTTAPSEKLQVSGGNVLVSNGTFTVSNGANQFKVYADGKVRAREVLVDLLTIPDYVFGETYPLMPIGELKAYIQQHKHLPGVPSEAEYQERGSINLGELDMKLLEKVEELTRYIIQLEERLKQLETQDGNSGPAVSPAR